MQKRIYSSLGYLTPVEFEAEWMQSQARSQVWEYETPRLCPVGGPVQWYDDHPEATFGEIEERARNPYVIPREQAVLGARPGVSR